MADWNAVGILGLLATWTCVLGLGLVLRRFVRRRPLAELVMWGYLVMGVAATHPHHLHRMSMDSRSFPGTSSAAAYLSAVVFDFVAMSLTWPILEYLLLVLAPPVNPELQGRARVEALTALVVSVILAPTLTFALRRWDRRAALRRAQG